MITPAVTGPFDLGTVVVRVALFVDPDTAQIRPYSDPIPDVFGGAKLSIRSIDVNANKKDFTINPTSCGKLETTGSIKGGGSNPTSEAAFSSFPVLAPFQPTDCGTLKFRPKLTTKILSGKKKTFRAKNPKFRATLIARDGDANLASAVVTLPKALILDQSHIKTICTRPQLAADACPKSSIYGHATAKSPLIGDPLSGPVYLVPSTHILPDLLVDLQGQVNVRLRGTVESVKAPPAQHLLLGPRRPGQQVRADHGRRQARPARSTQPTSASAPTSRRSASKPRTARRSARKPGPSSKFPPARAKGKKGKAEKRG